MKKKEARWFPHDSNAKDDPKCMLMVEELGLEAYGIYWVLVETLRDQPGYTYPVVLLPVLARRQNTTFEKVKAVVYNYGLFVIEGDTMFFSPSLRNRMLPMDEKRKRQSEGALKGNAKRWGNGRPAEIGK